ncbi:MAG: zinc metallopeptidase [Eggerthellaceae bacterium]|nr:zinc metallopeptidase [Eggerthellaceae bacterium]
MPRSRLTAPLSRPLWTRLPRIPPWICPRPGGERAGAWSVLRACALTYVAAALVSVLQLLYLLGSREE